MLSRHDRAGFDLEVSTPPSDDALTTQRQYDAYKGFEVVVTTSSGVEGADRTLEGTLVERDMNDVVINVKGRSVKVPIAMVGSVVIAQVEDEV